MGDCSVVVARAGAACSTGPGTASDSSCGGRRRHAQEFSVYASK